MEGREEKENTAPVGEYRSLSLERLFKRDNRQPASYRNGRSSVSDSGTHRAKDAQALDQSQIVELQNIAAS